MMVIQRKLNGEKACIKGPLAEEQVLSIYAKGMTTIEIYNRLENINVIDIATTRIGNR